MKIGFDTPALVCAVLCTLFAAGDVAAAGPAKTRAQASVLKPTDGSTDATLNDPVARATAP